MKEICPVCGSKHVVCLNTLTKKYRCDSCDEIFVLEDKPKIAGDFSKEKRLTPSEIYKTAIESTFELSCVFGEDTMGGTGFYISPNGYIITNCHIVIGRFGEKFSLCDEIYSCKSKATAYSELELVYVDPENDLALLKEDVKVPVKALKIADKLPEIGENVVAIGNSKGEGLALVNGIVSDVGRKFRGHPAFLFNALVSHGCSGRPVFNENGEVCGVTVGGHEDAEGMKYGIPVEILRKFIKTAEIEKDIKIQLL